MRDVIALIMAGGKGERLYPLTKESAKPAVTFGGIYKIIDFTLSNCLNSNIRRIYLLSQYSNATLEYCQIYENGYNGLAAEQFNTITMDHCDVWRNGTNGVHVDASTLEVVAGFGFGEGVEFELADGATVHGPSLG